MINFGNVPVGSVLPVMFNTFSSAGASVTITGLAVTDIEIYKGTSMTQRSSDAGYTLLDTDGIDIDGITGVHGFSIDLGDNTDAGFYAAGSFYTIVVSAITVDGQTVNFIAATFRIVVAEQTAGTPSVNVTTWNNLATVALPLVPTTAGRTVDVTATGCVGVDWANVEGQATAVNLSNTNVATVGSVTAVGNSAIGSASFAADAIDAAALATSAVDEIAGAVWDVTLASHVTAGSTGFALNAAGSAGDPWGTALPGAYGAGTAGHIIGTALPDIAPGAANGLFRAGGNAATSITTALTANIIGNVTGNISGSVGSVTGAVGSVTGNVGGNVTGSVGSVVGAVGSVTGNIGGNLLGTLSTTERDAIADALLNRDMAAVTVTNTRSPINGIRFLRNKWSISGTTLTVTEEDDSTSAWTATVSTDAAALPIIGNDPS